MVESQQYVEIPEQRVIRPRLWRFVLPIILAGFALVTAVAVVVIIDRALRPDSGVDFHSYWYSGLYVRAGINPFTAYRDRLPMPGPVSFIDGSVL